MQTAHAFSLVETAPGRDKRGAGPHDRLRGRGGHPVALKAAGSGRTPRRARRGSRGWLKPLAIAILVVGEWLLLIADIFGRFYFAC